MTKKIILLAVVFGLVITSGSAFASQVRISTNSTSYDIWPTTGPFSGMDHYRVVEIEIMALNSSGMGVPGQTITLSYNPDITSNTGGGNVPTTATEVGNGRYTASFKICEDSSASSSYSCVVVSNGSINVTATWSSVTGSYDFDIYTIKCNNCHPAGDNFASGCSDDHDHRDNLCGYSTCHDKHGSGSYAGSDVEWLHDAIIAGAKTDMRWNYSGCVGSADNVDQCTDCHDITLRGVHANASIDGTPVGCGVGPGADGSATCHGALNSSKPVPFVDFPADCQRCHTNLSRGAVTSEGAAPNINRWIQGIDHENLTGYKVVPCATCHKGAHNISIPKPGDSDINNQCTVCHTTLPTTDYRGPDCKGCHYNDTNNNGFLDSNDYINIHIRDHNPNYVWDSNDATPGDDNDDPTDATYQGTTITTDASGFRTSQNVKVKMLDADDTLGSPRGTWTETTNATGEWNSGTSYTTQPSDATGVWKVYVSTDGGTTYVLYDRFTVQAPVPEFPLGAGIALGASMLVYMWRRRKYKV